MANLKEIRRRISSVQSTMQITKAMKMVAAAKLRKAQNAVLQLRPYSEKLQEILGRISSSDSASQSPYTEQNDSERVLILALSSNKGLCGPFNINVAKKVMSLCDTVYNKQYKTGKLSIITSGKKAREVLTSRGYTVAEHNDDLFDNLSFEPVAEFAETLMKRFEEKEFGKIEIVYNQFKNAAVQNLVLEQFLPIQEPEKEEVNQKDFATDYIFEPSEDYIKTHLIPDSLKIQIYKAFLDSLASEHGARMTAMHMATDNASELIKELKLVYNKARQAAITTEINEITAGAEALKG